MKAFRLFSLAALALVMAACAKEVSQPVQPEELHFTATIPATNTKTAYHVDGASINVSWVANDQIALIHNGALDVATVTAVDAFGNATIEATLTGNPSDEDDIVLVYPAAAVASATTGTGYTPDATCWSKVLSQDGSLEYIQNNLDFRQGAGKIAVDGSHASLKASVTLNSVMAIWKLSLQANATPLAATGLNVRIGGTLVAKATSAAKSDYYICLDPAYISTGDLTIHASVGADTYAYTKSDGVTLNTSKFYQSTVTMTSLLNTPLTLEAMTAGTIQVHFPKSGMQYTLNGGAKMPVTSDAINVAAGNKVAFYGSGTTISCYSDTFIIGTAEVKAYGNIMSLVDETGFATATVLTEASAFSGLFSNNHNLTDASGLLLPATTLANYCYHQLFHGCHSLTAAPELPATTLANYCYYSLFQNCTCLTTAPELPATTLADFCYQQMFMNCTSLIVAPELPATTLIKYCYYYMFDNCTSLTTAPTLPAETLANACYYSMFQDCTSLTTAPTLPAETLTYECYRKMFQGCTSLTTAPTLPAETLANACYQSMFQGCTSLTTAPTLPAETLHSSCYESMFQGCTSLTTAPTLPAETLTYDCYRKMFQGCLSLNAVTCLATSNSASNCTTDWLNDVAASGTFTKAADMTDWMTGASGIPVGWSVLSQ